MATKIDKRIVEMELRNRQFEAASEKTLSTLDKLKEKLNFKGIGFGLEGISKSVKRIDFSPMTTGVDAVVTKFNALGVMGASVIQNLTNKVVNFGVQFGKDQFVKPIKDGLGEYETKIGAIQTILTNTKSKGTTLDQVIDVLDELNLYADKTIYNFAEMTRNIGTFTAAGVDLDKAAISIKGIANLAAGSGSSAQQAATAMYQLSQALSSGTVKLQDWNSVVNAGMGGELFQKALKKNAKALGKYVDETAPFRETLQDGWLTSDVLVKTLEEFANDETLTDAATKVKTFTQLIETLDEAKGSGWAKTWEIIVGDFEQAKTLWTAVSDTLGGLIEKQADQRNALLEGWVAGGGKQTAINSVVKAWDGMLQILGAIRKAWVDVFPPITSKTLINITNGFKNLIDFLSPTEAQLSILTKTFKVLFSVVKMVADFLFDIGGGFAKIAVSIKNSKLSESIQDIIDKLTSLNIMDSIGKTIDNFSKFVSGGVRGLLDGLAGLDITGSFKYIASQLKNMFKFITDFDLDKFVEKVKQSVLSLADVIGVFVDKMSNLDGSLVLSGSGMLGFGFVVSKIVGFFKDITNTSKKEGSIRGLIDAIKDGFSEIGDIFGNINKTFKVNNLMTIAKAIGIFAASLFVLALIPYDKLLLGLGAITVFMGELILAIKLLDSTKAIEGKGGGLFKISIAMVALATAIGILSLAAAVFSIVDIQKALIGLTALFGLILGFSTGLDRLVKNIGKTSLSLIAVSIAISILVLAIIPLALLPTQKIAQGLLALTSIFTILAFFMSVIDGSSFIKAATSLVILSLGVTVLVASVVALSIISWDRLLTGLGGLAFILLSIIVVTKTLNKSIKGVIAINMLALAITVLVGSVSKLSSLSLGGLIQGLLGLVVVLGALVVATKLLQTSIVGSAAIIGISLALFVLASSVKMLADIKTSSLVKSIVAITVLFAILLGAAAISQAVAVGLGILVVALLGLGLAIAIAGAGIFVLASAIGLLATVGVAGFTALSVGLTILADVIPFVVRKFLQGFQEILNFIVKNGPLLADSLGTIFGAFIASIPLAMMEATIAIINGFIDLCNEVAKQAVPLAKAVVDALNAIVSAIEQHWGQITDAMGRLMTGLLGGISQAIRDYGPQVISDMEYISGFIAEGLVRGFGAAIPNTIASIRGLGTDIIDALTGDYQNSFKAGYKSLIGYKDGVVTAKKETVDVLGKTLDISTKNLGPSSTVVPLSPVLDMKQPNLELTKFKNALTQTHKDAAKMEGTINTHQIMEVVVSGGAPVIVKGAGDQQTFNKVVGTLGIENEITNMLRRQNRR